MTGEMIKPQGADENRSIEYWEKVGGLDDAGVCIYPNYPRQFDMTDKIKEIFPEASIEAYDVYRGPRIDVPTVGEIFMTGDDENLIEWNLTSKIFPDGTRTFDEDGLLEFLRNVGSMVEIDDDKITVDDIEEVRIECPNCGSDNSSVNHEDHDKEWIYVEYNCLDCNNKYTGSFRVMDVENSEIQLK